MKQSVLQVLLFATFTLSRWVNNSFHSTHLNHSVSQRSCWNNGSWERKISTRIWQKWRQTTILAAVLIYLLIISNCNLHFVKSVLYDLVSGKPLKAKNSDAYFTSMFSWLCCTLCSQVKHIFNSLSQLTRFNLSVAIVDMVQVDPTQLSNQECLVTENKTVTQNSTMEVTSEKRFNWTSEQQGLVLGSFFYGYCITQVAGGWFADKYS